MHIVEVVPVGRGVLKGPLSFFSKQDVLPGSLVSAPVRGKLLPAVVLASRDARDEKLDLRASQYVLKKLGSAPPRLLFRDSFMRAVEITAHEVLEPVGSVLAALTFSSLLAAPRSLESPLKERERTIKPDTVVLQAERSERVHAYRKMVREAFAREKSVVIVCPTLVDVTRLQADLSRGIEERVVVVSSLDSERAQKRAWNRVATGAPLLIIGTPPVLSFPFGDVDVVVVERESARAYVSRVRPTMDFRTAARHVAAALGARLTLADFPLRVETYGLVLDGTYEELTRPQARTQSHARVSIVDVRTLDQVKSERRSFTALQPATYEVLQETVARGEHAVVFAARKGVASLTVCNDCGTPVTDPATNTPMVLHRTQKGNVFMSHRSGAVVPAERSCATCGGWNLVSLGIGVERVFDEIEKKVKQAKLLLFTQDTVPTHTVAERIMSAAEEPGTILVGTERMLPYLITASVSVVASIDSLLSLPAWRSEEHALSILFQLVEKTTDRTIVETRRPDSRVMKALELGGPLDFMRDELKERHTYGYPPFAVFVALVWSGTEAHIEKRRAEVLEAFREYELVGPLPPELIARGQYAERAVLRLDREKWPNDEVQAIVASLSPDIRVTVDPDDIV